MQLILFGLIVQTATIARRDGVYQKQNECYAQKNRYRNHQNLNQYINRFTFNGIT